MNHDFFSVDSDDILRLKNPSRRCCERRCLLWWLCWSHKEKEKVEEESEMTKSHEARVQEGDTKG
jgi:hypothetical protein